MLIGTAIYSLMSSLNHAETLSLSGKLTAEAAVTCMQQPGAVGRAGPPAQLLSFALAV